jgi:5-methyltetrahydropteroyltriglutamate--homocysteine methyltransferase
MAIPTEPIGSIARPPQLLQAITSFHAGKIASEVLDNAYKEALRDTIDRLEQTGSPILTDGEQTKPSFATYPLSGLDNLAPDGVVSRLPTGTNASFLD